MRTLDIAIEDASYAELDAVAREAGLTPAEFARRATAAAVRSVKARSAARRDEAGYQCHPVAEGEFTIDPADLLRDSDEAW